MNYDVLTPPPDLIVKCICGEVLQSVQIPQTEPESGTGTVVPCGCEITPEQLTEIITSQGAE